MRHHFDGRQAVQARHQRIVKRRRDRLEWQGARELVVLLPLLEQPGLQHGLGQFFHKQGDAIGPAHHLLEHRRG